MTQEQQDIINILEELNIPVIENDVNYWFIRTNSGDKFQDFYFGNYVAIGWDKFNNIEHIRNTKQDDLKLEIARAYNEDESRPGSVAAQIKNFVNEIKINDIVLIPISNCERIAFGRITSDAYLYEITDEDKMDMAFDDSEIDFLKRRDVEWITPSPLRRHQIDPLIIPIIYSHGAVVSANNYSNYINRTLFPNYYRNGEFHSTLRINKKDNVSAYEFNKFLACYFELADILTDITGETINKDDLKFKASFNSPGPVEFITHAASFFIILSSISLFINGAHVNLELKLSKLFDFKIDIKSDGLLKKLADIKKTSNEHDEKMKEIESKINDSKDELEIK